MLAMVSGVRALPRETVYLDRLLAAASRMARATQFREVLAAAVEQAEEFLGPVGGMLVLLDASRRVLVIAAMEDVPDSVICGNKSLPLAAHLPMADAVNTARAIWISGADERARRYPELAARTPEQYACGSLPLADAEVPLGLLCLIRMGADMGAGAAPTPFDEAERAFACVLADLVAAAVRRLTGVRESAAGTDTGADEIGIYEWDPAGDCLYSNPGMLRLHGQPPAGSANPGVEAISGGLPEFSAAARELAARGNGRVVSYPCLVGDGELRLLEARGYLVAGSQGRQPRLVGVVAQATPAGSDRAGELARHPANAAILGQLSAALATAVTVEDFRQATAAALPVLGADGLVIAGQEADRVYVVACAGVTSTLTRQMDSLPRAARMPAGETLSNRVPEYARSTDALLARYPHFRSMLGGLDDHAWAILPLASGSDAPAACLLAFPPGWSPVGSQQARFIMASGLLAQALDRCRTHDHEHQLVSQMRHGPPAALPGLTLAYGYRPSTFGLGVGGDFYDAMLQPEGTTALVIGDIQGHGSHVAAMADRLRTALRAYALDGHAPAEVMARASRFLAHLNRDRDNAQYATCCYVTFAPATGHVQICCAGHPHPIMLAENGPASLLGLDTGLTLGVDPDHRYSASAFTLTEGSTLVLYTDGLIERPGSDITLTTREILRELDEIRSAHPAAVLAGLHPLSAPGPRYDDIAVLAAHRTREPA
jgi:PAS domain-containing protein